MCWLFGHWSIRAYFPISGSVAESRIDWSIPAPFSSIGIFPNDSWVTSRGIIWGSMDYSPITTSLCVQVPWGPPSAPHITGRCEDVTHLCHRSQRRGEPCEVWARRVFYILLWHGLSVPDKHKNIFRILECIWNTKEKTQICLRFSRGPQKHKSSGKLPLVNTFYIIETALLFVLII